MAQQTMGPFTAGQAAQAFRLCRHWLPAICPIWRVVVRRRPWRPGNFMKSGAASPPRSFMIISIRPCRSVGWQFIRFSLCQYCRLSAFGQWCKRPAVHSSRLQQRSGSAGRQWCGATGYHDSHGAQRAARPCKTGLTVAGHVANYAPVTDAMLNSPPEGDWLMPRRNYQGWSYSPLHDIGTANVKNLQLKWAWAMNEGGQRDPSRRPRRRRVPI